ncbi:hypothetical protein [Listeria booriae]|uniref:hypothetical protein n=1 Tax=Listeria booriae TaxID=1552123 RepID=UPI001623CC57|nr:hypothetical protein [Listeria booriae]MBC1272684.1 hypothetical protein [Listeria booriae]
MRLSPIFLFRKVETGKDELLNPITSLEKFGESVGRFSNWSAEEIALDTRGVTKTTRKILTRLSKVDCDAADVVELEGDRYEKTELTKNYGRWRLMIVTKYRK